ncbi:BglG family transcriptional antiterminator [Labedella gwakjiensis]|uniref:BglG family transcriptional antiterminator n=1 Tax=Labedella gwakjiensis TaxID=390269 RepID=A0A2P8GRX5_9MICO|nr:PTS sugar transporter subunit IIA [Labedella gwakjiensis]PSL36729.1 BglG family transcriptional antiterminator [Labedella gwakjiensis]RUQ84243.1 PRD domain-containing protein [Labedella gwakjiensis]
MTRERQDRILAHLARASGWVTASELADALGVTPRSVRTYLARLRSRPGADDLVVSGPSGYRLDDDAYARFRRLERTIGSTETPRERSTRIIRALLAESAGVDVFALAQRLHVSDSTIEADLAKIRPIVADVDLQITRSGPIVSIAGAERDRRRLISRLFRDETAQARIDLDAVERAFASDSLSAFKTALLGELEARSYYVNDYGTDNVLLHIAIAVDRVSHDNRVPDDERPTRSEDFHGEEFPALLDGLVREHFGVTLGRGDAEYLGYLLSTRAVAPGAEPEEQPDGGETGRRRYLADEELERVRRITARAGAEYAVDLEDDDFNTRLALHVHNLLERASDRSFSRNPLTRSIKTSYPMIYELAVFIARELRNLSGVEIDDDEIAYIAMHVGAHLQQEARREDLEPVVLVCPNYYDLQSVLRARIIASVGDVVAVDRVVTRSDVPWSSLGADLVLSTIEPPVPDDSVLVIGPFFGEADGDRVRRAVSRVRRSRRRSEIATELLEYFSPAFFVRNETAADEEAMIRRLGELMIADGAIDEDYLDGVVERERMSSTAFTDTLAVPHAMAMSAKRTAIAIAVNEHSMPWGEARVNVVALIAFSADGRARFQPVFDQIVEVFSGREDVQRIIKGSVDFPSFIDELVHTMDA